MITAARPTAVYSAGATRTTKLPFSLLWHELDLLWYDANVPIYNLQFERENTEHVHYEFRQIDPHHQQDYSVRG